MNISAIEKTGFGMKAFPLKVHQLSLRHSQGIHVFWNVLLSNSKLTYPLQFRYLYLKTVRFYPLKNTHRGNCLRWCSRARKRTHSPKILCFCFPSFPMKYYLLVSEFCFKTLLRANFFGHDAVQTYNNNFIINLNYFASLLSLLSIWD